MAATQELGKNIRQFIQFCLVGGSGVVVNLIVTFIMTKLHGGVEYDRAIVMTIGSQPIRFTLVVWIVAFMVANTWNYMLNRIWTFASTNHRSWWAEFWPFFAVGLVAAVLGIFIKHWLTTPGSWIYLPDPIFNNYQGLRARAYWSQLLTIIITMPVNYLVNKVWTFRGTGERLPEPQVEHVLAGAPDRPLDVAELDGDVSGLSLDRGIAKGIGDANTGSAGGVCVSGGSVDLDGRGDGSVDRDGRGDGEGDEGGLSCTSNR